MEQEIREAPEEGKIDNDSNDERTNVLEERGTSERLNALHARMFKHISATKADRNSFGYALRVFKVSSSQRLGFPSIQIIRQLYGRVIVAAYIFKFHFLHENGCTHGIYVRINGYAPRRLFDQFLSEMVKVFAGGELELKAVVPIIKKNISLFDYLQTLYVLPQNLLVNYSHHRDAVSEDQSLQKLNHHIVGCLKERMHRVTSQILDNIVTMPTKYPHSLLTQILSLDVTDFKSFMRSTNINELAFKIGQDAYNMALQDYQFKHVEVQELLEPVIRRSMLNRCITEKILKQIQFLFQSSFGQSFVHPHPYNELIHSNLSRQKPLDGMFFDPKFLFPLLMAARWFARTCMRQEDAISNNHAHLMLYGGAGTGKTLIISAIASHISTYRYITNSRFQNPDILQSSLFSIEEFDTTHLPSNQYKQLLDLKSHVKTDFKNLHPENISEGVPCMITSNDDILTTLRSQRKYNSSSVDAAIRRLYILPMKMGQFDKLHGRLPDKTIHFNALCRFDLRFESECDKLSRMFNLILTFGLFQQDIDRYYFDKRLHPFFQKLISDFKGTIFGTFYLTNKKKIDDIIIQVETVMMKQDLNDTEYLTQVAVAVGQFQQLQYQFLFELLQGNQEINQDIIKDQSIPWPIKMYYLLSSSRFIVKLMWQLEIECKDLLNQEVKAFLDNPKMQLFSYAESVEVQESVNSHYEELKQMVDSDQEAYDPFSEEKYEEKKGQIGDDFIGSPATVNDIELFDIDSVIQKRCLSERFGLNPSDLDAPGYRQTDFLHQDQ